LEFSGGGATLSNINANVAPDGLLLQTALNQALNS
jgi:hypothetical protein